MEVITGEAKDVMLVPADVVFEMEGMTMCLWWKAKSGSEGGKRRDREQDWTQIRTA